MFDCVEISFDGGQLLCAFDGNKLHDLLFLHDGSDDIGAIYRAKVERPIKGIGGVFLSLGGGQKGFWRIKNPPREGATLPLQIVQTPMQGKPARLSERLDFRGIYCVLTPGREGVNVSRQWTSELENALREKILQEIPKDCGLILRSEAEGADANLVFDEVQRLVAHYQDVQNSKEVGLIVRASTGRARAELEWGVKSWSQKLNDIQKDAIIEALALPLRAAGGTIQIDQTQALIAIDIDTAQNTAPTAGRDVNTRAVAEICRWLRLMGWGGQLLIDTAPMPMQARKGFEAMMQKAAKSEKIDLVGRGFGPLGLFEGQIRYTRRPISLDILEL